MKIRFTWFGFAAAAVFLITPSCVSYAKYAQVADALAKAQEDLAYADDRVGELEMLLAESNPDGVDPSIHADTVAQLDALRAERERLQEQVNELARNSGDLGAVSLVYNADEGMVGYSAAGDVLFASGSTDLTKDGRAALDVVYSKLSGIDAMVRVDGHTDSDPINKTKDKFPHGNIHLGAMRAIAVREYLISKGMPESRVYIASYGPHSPVARGNDAASKKQNRRVAVMVPVRDALAQG